MTKAPTETRKCRNCGSPHMAVDQVFYQGFGNVLRYVCPDCGHRKDFVAKGKLGSSLTMITLGVLIVGGFLYYLNFETPCWDCGWITVVGLVFIALWIGLAVHETWPYFAYPVTGERRDGVGAQDLDSPDDPIQKSLSWVDGLSFITGVLAPILLIIVVLGTAVVFSLTVHMQEKCGHAESFSEFKACFIEKL
ncbi:MAG: hypothetical protein ACPGOY_02150 [Rhodospirillaceae bacterium]